MFFRIADSGFVRRCEQSGKSFYFLCDDVYQVHRIFDGSFVAVAKLLRYELPSFILVIQYRYYRYVLAHFVAKLNIHTGIYIFGTTHQPRATNCNFCA
jgi:hypothetical protein